MEVNTTPDNTSIHQKKTRGRKRKAFNIEQTRQRKRENRESANRNDYGNEGFLMMMLYYLGCEIKMRRMIKEGKHQKLKIEEITHNNQLLVSRDAIEDQIDASSILKGRSDEMRNKRVMTIISIDNGMLDVLKTYFGFVFDESVKKKPEKEFMPERRTLEHISLSKEWVKKDIVEEGCLFYDNIKSCFSNSTEFVFSKNTISQMVEVQNSESVISSSMI